MALDPGFGFIGLFAGDVVGGSGVANVILRIFLGALLIGHGLPKPKDLNGAAAWVRGSGWFWGTAFVIPFTLLETLGGLGVLLGFLTRLLAGLFVLEMIATTAFQKVKLGNKLATGYEADLLFLGVALALLVLGPGPWSFDAWLGW